MKLGNTVQITIGVRDVAKALAFYEKLGFAKIDQNVLPWPWAQLSDGQNLLLLNQDGNYYIGLNYFSPETAEQVAQMEAMGIQFVLKQEQEGRLYQAIFMDTNGLMVGLTNHNGSGMPKPTGEPLTKCGKFGEFSVAVEEFEAAAAYWNRLGFDTLFRGGNDPYPWGILSDGLMVLGLHQTEEFKGPAITYFAGDMAARIGRLKEEGFEFAVEMPDEQGVVANAVLQAPDGEQLFLFQGEV